MCFGSCCILQVMTSVVKRRTILLSCWGPGVTLPSCTSRGGQRHTVPEICSACAHTDSPSTDTSTTTRYQEQNIMWCGPLLTQLREHGGVLSCLIVLVFEFSWWPAVRWFHLMCLQVQGFIRYLLNTLCRCWQRTASSCRDFLSASDFLFRMSKVYKSRDKCWCNESPGLLCPLSKRFLHMFLSSALSSVYYGTKSIVQYIPIRRGSRLFF